MITETLTERQKLEAILPDFDKQELKELLKYAKYLQWSNVNYYDDYEEDDDDGSWADAPLTPEEEEGLRRGRENAKNGKYLTLAEFRERMRCGQ